MSYGTTPDRQTVLRLDDGPWIGKTQDAWALERPGADMGLKNGQGPLRSQGVRPVAGGVWMLAPFNGAPELVVTEEWHDAVVHPDDTNHPDGYETVYKYRKPADPTLDIPGNVLSLAVPGLQRRKAAGDSAEATLGEQQTSLPGMPDPSGAIFPTDRILETRTSFPENSGFNLVVGYPPNHVVGARGFAAIFFGGSTDVSPSTEEGGQFSLVLHGDGTADFYERDQNAAEGWAPRKVLGWSANPDNAQAHDIIVSITPYGRNRVAFRVASTDSALAWSDGWGAHAATTTFNKPHEALWDDTKEATGHRHLHFATGPGSVQLEVRRDIARQTPVWLLRHKYASTGVLVDAPFVIERDLPGGTPIRSTLDTYLLPNTGASVALYDATTHELLDTDGDGNFLTNEGQTRYYAKFTLTSDNQYNSPVLYGYRLEVAGSFQEITGSPVLIKPRSLSHTGPDATPEHESAELAVSDLNNSAGILRSRDRIFSRVSVYTRSTGDLLTHLMEGETTKTPAKKRGRTNRSYPDPEWRDYQVRMVGPWARLADQFNVQTKSFDRDPTAPIDPVTGERLQLSWKITDIIRWWFDQCGVPADELDIPDYSLRLSDLNLAQLPKETYNALFGADSSRMLVTLIRDFLGHYLVRDANASKSAGARGLWRALKPHTVADTNYLFDVYIRRPSGSAGKSGTAFGTYGDNGCWVYRDSFNTSTRAPEANVVYVYGVSQGRDEGGASLIKQWKRNKRSLFDPSYPGYIGRVVPLIRVDPNITTQETANFLTARYFEIACLPQKWAESHLPAIFVTDPLDPYQVRPRLPRINDLFRVIDGSDVYPAIVRNCNALVDKNDAIQGMDLEGMFLNPEALLP